MKTLWRKFYYSQFGQYLLHCAMYCFFWKLWGIELTSVIAFGHIMGELSYINIMKNKSDQ